MTNKPAGRKLYSSWFSNLLRRSIVPEETLHPQLLEEFLDSAGQFKRILEDSGFIQLDRLPDVHLASHREKERVIEKYCYLCENDKAIIKDISFKDGIRVGNQYCQQHWLTLIIFHPYVDQGSQTTETSIPFCVFKGKCDRKGVHQRFPK